MELRRLVEVDLDIQHDATHSSAITISAPPRPPRRDPSALEALREQALIEEARRRARLRRLGYAAAALATAAVAATLGFVRGGTTAALRNDASARPGVHIATARNGKLAFQGARGAIELLDPDGSGPLAIEPCRPGTCNADDPAWSRDGGRIAFLVARGGGGHAWPTWSLYVADASGRHQRRLAVCGSCGTQWGARLGWSPDGRSIVFSRDAGPGGQQSLWIVAAAGGAPRRLTRCASADCVDVDPVWSPDGRMIAFARTGGASNGLYTMHADGSAVTRIGGGGNPEWSPDGRQIAFDGVGGVGVVNADGSGRRLLNDRPKAAGGPGVPSWSPDGTKIAFFATPGRRAHFRAEVWTMNADGSAPTRLYHSGCCVSLWAAPIWSPDGRRLAFAASSANGLFVVNVDGSGLRRLVRAFPDALAWQALPTR